MAGADGAGVIEQAVLFFLGGEAGEFRVEGVVGEEETLLAVEDGRVGTAGVVVAVDLPGAEVELDATEQGRVRVGIEVGINQIRELAGAAVDLDDVGAFDVAEVDPAAAFVDAQDRVQGMVSRFRPFGSVQGVIA